MQFDSVYYLSTHVLLYQWRQLRGIVFGFKIWSDPYAALPGFLHLTKGPFSHEKCSHASLSFSLSLCHVMPCHATPCRIMSRRTRPRQADVVPPIYHPLSFPPILAAPFAEQWKCIDRRMARAGKRTGFPSQPPTPSLCLSLSLPFRLVVSFLLLVLHSFLPPSVYLPLLWNTFRIFPLSLSPPCPPAFSILYGTTLPSSLDFKAGDAALRPPCRDARRRSCWLPLLYGCQFTLLSLLRGKIFMPMYRFAGSSSFSPDWYSRCRHNCQSRTLTI